MHVVTGRRLAGYRQLLLVSSRDIDDYAKIGKSAKAAKRTFPFVIGVPAAAGKLGASVAGQPWR